MISDFRSISFFKKTAPIGPTITQDVVSFFQTASPFHYSLLVTGVCVVLLVFILILCICYLRIPHCLATFLCCFTKHCCLKKRALERQADLSRLHVMYSADATELSSVQIRPSAPAAPEMVPAHISVQSPAQVPLMGEWPSAVQGFVGQGNVCINQIPDCFCARYCNHALFTCMKDSK